MLLPHDIAKVIDHDPTAVSCLVADDCYALHGAIVPLRRAYMSVCVVHRAYTCLVPVACQNSLSARGAPVSGAGTGVGVDDVSVPVHRELKDYRAVISGADGPHAIGLLNVSVANTIDGWVERGATGILMCGDDNAAGAVGGRSGPFGAAH